MTEIAFAPSIGPLHAAYIALLGRFRWDWFCTMTFRDHVTYPERADKAWRVWISKLNRRIFGVRWYRADDTQILWIRALEYHKGGGLHIHALIGDARNMNRLVRRLDWMDEWNELAGHARIYPISSKHSDHETRRYVTKYVAKGGEIELSPSLRSVPTKGTAQLDF